MIAGVPVALLVAYAVFRMCEYFALKNYQALAEYGAPGGKRGPEMVFGAILLPARIGGWALLIWLAFKIGIGTTILMVVFALLLSLVLQITLGMLVIRVLGAFAGVVFLVAVPILGVLIAFMIAAL